MTAYATIQRVEELLSDLVDSADHMRYTMPEEEDQDNDGDVVLDSAPFASLETITEAVKEIRSLLGVA